MKKLPAILIVLAALASSCNQNKIKTDASGVFESDEVIVFRTTKRADTFLPDKRGGYHPQKGLLSGTSICRTASSG